MQDIMEWACTSNVERGELIGGNIKIKVEPDEHTDEEYQSRQLDEEMVDGACVKLEPNDDINDKYLAYGNNPAMDEMETCLMCAQDGDNHSAAEMIKNESCDEAVTQEYGIGDKRSNTLISHEPKGFQECNHKSFQCNHTETLVTDQSSSSRMCESLEMDTSCPEGVSAKRCDVISDSEDRSKVSENSDISSINVSTASNTSLQGNEKVMYSNCQSFSCQDSSGTCREIQNDKTQETYNTQMGIHSYKSSYKCLSCEYTSRNSTDFEMHIKTHSFHQCPLCQYKCKKGSILKAHIRTHTGEKPYKCQICESAFAQKTHLKAHMMIHSGEKPYKCELCQYECRYSTALKIHLRNHTGEKPYKCHLCEYSFRTNGDLNRHIKTHTVEKRYKCQFCEYECDYNSRLQIHMRTHTGKKYTFYQCQLCQYKCKSSSLLKGHIRTHTGEKPYKCQTCESTFSQKTNLKAHMMIHSGEKPYKCQICEFAFSRRAHLETHMKTHTGEKPYKCQTCESAFAQKGNLKAHMRTHTGEKPYKCQICEFAFSQRTHLKSHMKTHTRESN